MTSQKSEEQELLQLATTSTKEGDFEHALIHLKTLIATNPKHEIALGMLAAVYAELKMIDHAVDHYRRVLGVNPENPLARLQLGILQLAAKRPQDVLETWKPTLKDTDDFLGHYYSGLALLQLERSTEARTMLEESARRMPEDHVLYPQLKEMLNHLGK